MTDTGRDRLRELLDAVLDDDNDTLDDMAAGAFSSVHHFSRQLSKSTGESPVALRRRVMLERAAWELQRGQSVTDTAFAAGYDSVDGFTRAFGRAFGHPPSRLGSATARGHWLPAPNGIHFHSPTVLYIDGPTSAEDSAGDVLALLVRHDLDDVAALLDAAKNLDDETARRPRLPGHQPLAWSGPEESIMAALVHLVVDKRPWLATIEGADMPTDPAPDTISELIDLHADLAPRWLALTRDIDRRQAWGDRIVDALCDPPESFLLSQIWAHVLTFSAHRRLIIRWMLSDAGLPVDHLDPDPIIWHRQQSGGFA
ncbi:helix-turn-helix transcriptional regulator [Gordonia sp. CPCC 205515]|uniref:helix-turn-helix domain-containing protein n=1 Tax=Gordonia sp. CPCC 205515 TaxID=3140791 RepID=UPI003AF37D46